MSGHSVKALNIITSSQEFKVLLNAVDSRHIRIHLNPAAKRSVCENNTGRSYIQIVNTDIATISIYLLRLLNNSSTLDRYSVYVNNVLVNTANLPKEISDCINIPEVKALILKHRLGVSQ